MNTILRLAVNRSNNLSLKCIVIIDLVNHFINSIALIIIYIMEKNNKQGLKFGGEGWDYYQCQIYKF